MDPNVIMTGDFKEMEDFIEKHGSLFVSVGSTETIAPNYEQCNMGIQGYLLGSFAYKNILLPQVKCAIRSCSATEQGLLDAGNHATLFESANTEEVESRKLATTCSGKYKAHFRAYNDNDNIKICNLVHAENYIFTSSQLPGGNKKILEEGRRRRDPKDSRIHIALGFPTTSKGNPNPSIATITFFKIFLPTFLQTISQSDGDRFLYRLYMGFDEHDAYFDNAENQKQIYAEVKARTAGYPVTFEMIKIDFSKGWVVYLWNGVFQHAIENGADYFYQLNDDIRFITPGWAAGMTKALQQSRIPDVGATGPQDTNNAAIFTQSFVSKKHYEIFGVLYPTTFENWYSDDWMTQAYKKQGLVFQTAYQVHNNQDYGTRYVVCSDAGRDRLASSLDYASKLVDDYINEQSGGGKTILIASTFA